MDKLLIDFSHCVSHATRELLGDDECKRIIIETLKAHEIGSTIRTEFAHQLDLFN